MCFPDSGVIKALTPAAAKKPGALVAADPSGNFLRDAADEEDRILGPIVGADPSGRFLRGEPPEGAQSESTTAPAASTVRKDRSLLSRVRGDLSTVQLGRLTAKPTLG